MKKRILIAVVVVLVLAATASLVWAAYTVNAAYHSHGGTITPTGGTIAEAVAAPEDGKFVQLAPWSWIVLRFPGHDAAVPDGTTAADLRVDTYDVPYPADAEIFVSLDGSNWTSVGVHADTANIDLDIEGTGPVKYVKVDQADHYIDPAYPTLGFDLDAVVALNAGTLPYGEITSPGVDEVVFGSANFGAVYWDDDPGWVDWAVRYETCAAATNTVFGNVDGHSDPFSWDGHLFQATADTSGWTPGHYCFVFNPREEAGETNIRLTRWFYVVDGYVSGGGQLIEEQDGLKRKDWNVISFGGWAASAGASGFLGEMQINFHNVGDDTYDKATFHTTSIYAMNFYHNDCIAMNFYATGVLNGTPGYRIIFRAQDAGEPGSLDNVRIQLFEESVELYDTYPTEFEPESNCFGTARTMLDNGNLQMDVLP